MRKLLAGFLMTLRWLLVMLLPVLGIVGGWLLMPEEKPAWTYTLDHRFECLGFHSGEVGTSYQIYDSSIPFFAGGSDQRVVGLDIDTGKELFAKQISFGAMISGTTYELVRDAYSYKQSNVVLFDWENQKEIGRFDLDETSYSLKKAKLAGDTVACVVERGEEKSFVCWNINSTKPLCQYSIVPDPIGLSPFIDYELSPDGRTVILLCHHNPSLGPSNAEDHYGRVLDLQSGKEIQIISRLEHVHWQPDSRSFMALLRNEQPGFLSFSWQSYQRSGNTFIKNGKSKEVTLGIIHHGAPGGLVVINTTNVLDPVRTHLLMNYGRWGYKLVQRLWPEAPMFNVYQSATGELVKSWTLPGVNWNEGIQLRAHPRLDAQGLILNDVKEHTLSYWAFYPATRWYPRLGLALGITLAILLAWRNLRRTREVKPTHA